MDITKKAILFEKIEENRIEYKKICEEYIKLYNDYYNNLPTLENVNISIKYNEEYQEKECALDEKCKELDDTWIKLRKELLNLIKV